MTLNQLIQAVALRMDEITPDSALSNITVDASDNNPLYELIKGLVDDGVLELFSVAPYWRLPQTVFEHTDFEAIGSSGRYMLRCILPDDFLRVAEINCTGFKRPITEVVPEGSSVGKRQHNRFLMGKEVKPVGVMSHGHYDNTSCREIDCYSLSTNIGLNVDASYIARPIACALWSGTNPVEDNVPPTLIPALEWLIAARTFGARGDANHAAICQQNAQNLLV